MIDILAAGGLLIRVMEASIEEEKIKLNYIVDEKTQAKLCGISGRSYTLEKDYYKILDREALEKENGFRVFVMHSALNEVKPFSATYDQGIPISYLPRGLQYYAGGHIHEFVHDSLSDYGEIVYPGALFGSSFADLEIVAKGGKRGYVIVEFDKDVKNIEFIENKITPIEYQQISGENKTSQEVSNILEELIEEIDPKNKIILIKVTGTLSLGLPSDVKWDQARQKLNEKGAEYVYINRRGLSAQKPPEIKTRGDTPQEIEKKILEESLKEFTIPKNIQKPSREWLKNMFTGENGLQLAVKLIEILKNQKQEGETTQDFNNRIEGDVLEVLPLRRPE
jgi:DNA repair exonuclease SbcCD nuclease subunit